MRFDFLYRGKVIGSVEYRNGDYIYGFDENFFWLENYIADLLSASIHDGEDKLFPPNVRHLRATMEFFSILKTAEMDWNRFVEVVGGDIREIEVREVSDEGKNTGDSQ